MSGASASITEDELDANFTDNHLVSWQEVAKGGHHRLIGDKCVRFLRATETATFIFTRLS
jgi:hypothetical protein